MKKVLSSILAALCFHGSVFGFTIINQTDTDKVLEIQEAYRPGSDQPGNVPFPKPLREEAHKISIPAHSSASIHLTECPDLLVSVVTTEVSWGVLTKTDKVTTCYEPYGLGDKAANLLTDDWGIVIHKPFAVPTRPSGSDYGEYFRKKYIAENNLKQGYGIKCLHPQYLEQVASLEDLPEELQ
jgi:hypothetical protein